MPKSKKLLMFALAAVFTAGNCWPQADSQSPKAPAKPVDPPKYFRLDFVVKDVENGKQVNARNYSLTASTGSGSNCSVRSSDKVPTSSGKDQFTYLDIGVSLDCREMTEVDGKLALTISADITGAVTDAPSPMPGPVIRAFKWSSKVIVPLRKATIVYSSDGASSKRGMELELTATPVP